MSKTNLFFDLDGTLIDATQRLYQLFKHLVPETQLSYKLYWELKRKQIDHAAILKDTLNFSEARIRSFQENWMRSIEQPEWLHFDKPFDGVTVMLNELSLHHQLYLVTSRQCNPPVHEQVKRFQWETLFTKVIITNQIQGKAQAVLTHTEPQPTDWFIGDTGIDIQQGKILRVKTAAVLSGFRNRESLLKYAPDLIAESVLHVPFTDAKV